MGPVKHNSILIAFDIFQMLSRYVFTYPFPLILSLFALPFHRNSQWALEIIPAVEGGSASTHKTYVCT